MLSLCLTSKWCVCKWDGEADAGRALQGKPADLLGAGTQLILLKIDTHTYFAVT